MRSLLTVALLALGVAFEACTRDSVQADRFRLRTKPSEFALQDLAGDTTRPIVFPREWLVPPGAESEEREYAVSSFAFDSQVTAFPIGNGQLGIHLASYVVNEAAALIAAVDRDAFLVYDPAVHAIRPGLVGLGWTGERGQLADCRDARSSHFLLADINGDGLVDLGRVQESLACDWKVDRPVGHPWYEQSPAWWYVMHAGRWERDPTYDGRLPERYTELPLLGISSTPVDFVATILWKTYDPAKWDSRGKPPPHLPGYRKRLIEQERRQGKR